METTILPPPQVQPALMSDSLHMLVADPIGILFAPASRAGMPSRLKSPATASLSRWARAELTEV